VQRAVVEILEVVGRADHGRERGGEPVDLVEMADQAQPAAVVGRYIEAEQHLIGRHHLAVRARQPGCQGSRLTADGAAEMADLARQRARLLAFDPELERIGGGDVEDGCAEAEGDADQHDDQAEQDTLGPAAPAAARIVEDRRFHALARYPSYAFALRRKRARIAALAWPTQASLLAVAGDGLSALLFR